MELLWLVKSLLVFVVLIGHGAGWVACFNRINATGLSRKTIKVIEKFFILICLILPLIFFSYHSNQIYRWIFNQEIGSLDIPVPWRIYASLALVSFVTLAPGWIVGRIALQNSSPFLMKQIDRSFDLRTDSDRLGSIFKTARCRRLGELPFNEIGTLEVSEKHLFHPSLPVEWMNLRVGHISDIHLTGHFDSRYPRFAFEQLMELRPDLIVLSGDIIDYDHELDQLESMFGPLQAPLGKYFVLGNHDRRLSQPQKIRDAMVRCGWIDLGSKTATRMDAGRRLRLIGNERPWFGEAPVWSERDKHPESDSLFVPEFRLAVSHSPDQWPWALKQRAHWLLAGHTHGGQVRLPLLGPVIAPSWYGSRFASGVFMQEDLLMHVSRGLSGVHLLRWRCMPEVSLLVASPVEHAKEHILRPELEDVVLAPAVYS